jgi:hypothetical protein
MISLPLLRDVLNETYSAELSELAKKGLKSLSAMPYLPLKRENKKISPLYPPLPKGGNRIITHYWKKKKNFKTD